MNFAASMVPGMVISAAIAAVTPGLPNISFESGNRSLPWKNSPKWMTSAAIEPNHASEIGIR